VLNRYMTLMSEPIRRNSGILDKYIGDGIMAFWGPPFTGADEQARLACLAALDQIAGLGHFALSFPTSPASNAVYPRSTSALASRPATSWPATSAPSKPATTR
jgi:hypothetical protein